jgi:hypothetical protein
VLSSFARFARTRRRASRVLYAANGVALHRTFSALSVGAALAGAAGCADEYPSAYAVRAPAPSVLVVEPAGPPAVAASTTDPSRILVLQSTHLDRPSEVVGVIDAHLAMGSDQAALDVVRQRAAALGADAVVGVEFHHGEGTGEPTHLSGLAVRFIDPRP